jgi:hypothetical protein
MAEAASACRHRERCALCGSRHLDPVLSLRPSPLGNALRHRVNGPLPTYPLALGRCGDCGHVQLLDIVDRLSVLGRPAAADATSPGRTAAAEAFAQALLGRLKPASEQLIVDIGSNDGTFLKVFEDAGLRVQGIEPAVNLAGEAIRAGLPTHAGLFLPSIADRIEDMRGRAVLIVAHQAFAEAEDPFALIEGVRMLLRRDGTFAFSVAALAAMVAADRLDRIDHRSLSYHTVSPLKRFLAEADLELVAVARRGDRLEGLAQRFGGPLQDDGSVARIVADEAAAGLADASALQGFAARTRAGGKAVAQALLAARAEGARMAGLGAGCGAATWLSQLGEAASALSFLADQEPERQGLFFPLFDLPIRPLADLGRERIDLLLILDPDAAAEASATLATLAASGTRLLSPNALPGVGAARGAADAL